MSAVDTNGMELLQEAVASPGGNERLYRQAIFALEEANRTEEALRLAQHAKELFPNSYQFTLTEALMLPVLYRSEEEATYYRGRYARGLNAITSELKLKTAEHRQRALEAIRGHVNFYLGYQGHNDFDLQRQYGDYVHKIVAANYPQWVKPLDMPPVPEGGRIRVGYISAHFREHSVTKLYLGWLTERNRQDFEVFSYHNGGAVDCTTDKVRRTSDHFRHLPGEFEALCEAIRADNLHVAVFLDVRHRRMAMMSSMRLAPVQCVAWAHPITTGSPMIDYYLSSELMEPPNGQDHYIERLIRLPGIGVYYPKPVILRPLLSKPRAAFGLKDGRTVFLCCQSTFKYLPQHDDIFVRIASKVPDAQFVFLALNEAIAKDFKARLEKAFAKENLSASDYCVILPQLSVLDYWNLNLLSDVFLDSLEWSGGVTALEAIACEIPIVTMPGEYMRGRHSYGILTQLGVTETIARNKDGYVDIAVRLATDAQWRKEVRQKMASRQRGLYSDTRSVRAIEDFFRSVTLRQPHTGAEG